ncbi:hypothetical protein N7478_004434 [Penicillium angulare]|uniref:uncharacterized protein n=1 Tax=Penicillium angulare TaxID=116970 RepID=UPI002540889E|nr:uncharacterized protein N7478_004434 [Penicillium angulare]KAJ5279062.1 hypothetical protein N7478_004434 [Penicillium angulare]
MGVKDRFNAILRPLQFIWLSIQLHFHTLKEAIRKDGLATLKYPRRIHNIATADLFLKNSGGFIAYEDTTCVPSLVSSAQGNILELGPGPGNQLHRFDLSLVEFIYAVDPNPCYGDEIAAKTKKLGLQDKYKLLECGVEDSDILLEEGIEEGSLDTILSIQVLCAVGDVKGVMKAVWKLLKPGGSFIFWEHEKNKDRLTAVSQACLNPAWSTFIGCQLTREILPDILAAGEWENPDEVVVADEQFSPLPRVWGVLKKKA